MAWCGIVLALGIFSGYQVTQHWQFQTDVLALLPQANDDPTLRSLRQLAAGTLGRTALFLVGHDQAETARSGARELAAHMAASPLFESVLWDHGQTQSAFFDLYFPLRYHVLSPSMRQDLRSAEGYHRLIRRLKQVLYQPTSAFVSRFLEADPLLFFMALIQDWGQQATQFKLQDGVLSVQHQGRFYTVITAQLAVDPFATQAQTQFATQWREWEKTLHRTWPDLTLTYTSLIRFATTTQQAIQRDILFISIGSVCGVIFLTVSTFGSFRQLFLALIPVVVGMWSAVGMTLWLFGSLHALTLTFGASLIGICIDYSFHYFAHHRLALTWHAEATMRQLLPALGLGALTTLLSYLGLALTPLVGLQQIAVFASCGILVSFGTVVVCFPAWLKQPYPYARHPPLLYRGGQRLFRAWHGFRRPLLYAGGLALICCLPGLFLLNINDSPRALNALPQELLAQDQLIRSIIGTPHSQTYIIVEGTSAEDALQKLEQLQARLSMPTRDATTREAPEAPVVLGPVLTAFLPSLKQQKADLAAAQSLLDHEADIRHELLQIGFAQETIAQFFDALAHSSDGFLHPQAWLHHRASLGLRHLWLGDTSTPAILVQVLRVNDMSTLQKTLAVVPGSYYVDQVADFTRVSQHYRRQAIGFVAGAYILIFSLLVWRYGKRGVIVMLPPLCAAVMTISILGYLGYPFHLMHVLALLLILGMGIDYTIFIAESAHDTGPTTVLALILSALTTLLSFGLLGFSSQAVLQAIGVTTFIGIGLALLLAPLAQYAQHGQTRP